MAKVDINIIKEWFRNLKKPNQDQFWAWLDSFRHKDDKIPMDDVTNLTQTLTKKADLVGGVVPPHQLPFSVDGNEVIALGAITVTTNQVNIAVHESGSNMVRINGQILTRSFPDQFAFTPVTAGSKFLRIVARNENGLFFLKEGVESDEPQEPSLDAGELHVRLILVTPEGNQIDPELLTGFKEKAEDNWKTTYVFSNVTFTLSKDDVRTRFLIARKYVQGIDPVDPIYNIRGIHFLDKSRETEFLIKNDTPDDVFLLQNDTTNVYVGFAENYTIKSGQWVFVKYNKTTDRLDILKIAGSEGMSTVVTDSTLKGTGAVGSPLGLSEAKNAEIAGKENANNRVIAWSATPSNNNYPSEKLVKDSIDHIVGGLVQPIKIISTSTTVDNSFHNAIVIFLSNVTITIPTGLRQDLNFTCFAKNTAIATFVAGSGVLIYAPTGLVLRDNGMCTLFPDFGLNLYNLIGGLVPA